MSDQVRVGTYEGTGAAINVELGWIPDYVRIVNVEDGDEAFDWFNGMGAGDAVETTNHADTQMSLLSANAVDTYAGDSTPGAQKRPGFTVGTACSENGKTYRYVAMRNAAS